MIEEIFGPILPVLVYDTDEELLELINSREKPLGLYIYSQNKKFIELVMNNTSAGGTCINHNSVHFYNNKLPFGGVNNSGMGKSHGHSGFKEFSNERGVYRQHFAGPLELLLPPYNNFKKKIIDLTMKYF
jgi:aldehyde dehydrogenase (NAD+)